MTALREQLHQGLAALAVGTQMAEPALAWLALLEKWNRAFNLTAIPQPQRVAQLILTSVAAIPYLRPGCIADVGSGGGVPGVPLAMFAPDNAYVLIDSNGKKFRFLNQCCTQLGLKNVQPVCSRVQTFNGSQFDTIITRAFACFSTFTAATRHLGGRHTRWLSFKHNEAAAQAEIADDDDMHRSVHRLEIPGLSQPVFLLQAQMSQAD